MNLKPQLGLWSGLVMMVNPAATHVGPPTVAGWPAIQALHAEYVYERPDQPEEDAPYLAYILDVKGNKIYRFECHRGGYHDDGYDMDFKGEFQCMLFPYKGETVTAVNLLAANVTAELKNDWHNRGRILTAQLKGECLDYPEYSFERHFTLRGMALTLGIRDVTWRDKGLKFTLVLDAAPDADAKTEVAAEAIGRWPPRACYP